MTKVKTIECPVCLATEQTAYEHHCHLEDAVLAFARVLVAKQFGVVRAQTLPSARGWKPDTRISAIQRFAPIDICPQCNSIDCCDLKSRPGPYFSLSAAEMRHIRVKVGNRANQGPTFRRELEKVRQADAADFSQRLGDAARLGADIAMEWIGYESSRMGCYSK